MSEKTENNTTAEASAVENTETTPVEEVKVKKEYKPVPVTLDSLLAAGAHFGHQAERWNPKMLPFIYGKKNNVHVINLDLTLDYWAKAQEVIKAYASKGKKFLFVGTKDQAQETVAEAATRCGAFYVNNRWLGGTLTNHGTIKNSIRKMKSMETLLEKAEDSESEVKLAKKEKLQITRDLEKLSINLSGIREMKYAPDVIFIVDINKDSIAVQEAIRLHIPVIALVDTNTNPDVVNFPIPSNDDSKRSIELFTNAISDCILDGRKDYDKAMAESEKIAKKAKKEATVKVEKKGVEKKIEKVEKTTNQPTA